jgi:histidine triad (HIT) family protein
MNVPGCPRCESEWPDGRPPGEEIYRDDYVIAYHAAIEDVAGYLGYVFVQTRRHVRGLADRTDSEAVAEARLVTRLGSALEREGAEHVYSFVFDHTPHHHAHLVARYPGTPQEYWGPTIDQWPDAPRGDAGTIRALCERLRLSLTKAGRPSIEV